MSPDQVTADEQRSKDIAAQAAKQEVSATDLGAYIRNRWMIFRNHRNQGNNPISQRLLHAQRMFEGKYDPEKLVAIKEFGGSEVYSRLVATKCRGASALLRDVYLGAQRPWSIDPTPDPAIPADIQQSIVSLIASEVATQAQAGQPVMGDQAHMRYTSMMHAAQQAARRTAQAQADAASDKIDDILHAGQFYQALGEFLVDLPLFPFAVIKGPVVQMVPKMEWVGGQPILRAKAQMFWKRVSPFSFYWTPGASKIEEAEIIETLRLTRADLQSYLDVPGFDEAAVRGALQDYAMGLRDWINAPDTEQALNEARESPYMNLSHFIDALEYHGCVQGRMLLDQGVDPKQIPDEDRDYLVQSWVVGRHTIKTQITPSPRQRVPYFITSFEKVPGTIIGHGLADILEDYQEAANACLRSLVNNMAMASGPQVVIDESALAQTENGDDIYPWKRWRVNGGGPPGTPTGVRQPITFFQPDSRAQELLQVFQQITTMADDVSAIPRYITGESLSGGAGRTASGLSMLMGNAQKVLQTVAGNIDTDVLEPLLQAIYDMIMLTDTTGMLAGNEQVVVNGVHVSVQKETERQKQLQFLQITNNPQDAQIVGTLGRARLLRSLSQDLGLPDDIVPDDETLEQQQKAAEMAAQQQQALQTYLAMHGIKPGPATEGTQQELLNDPPPDFPGKPQAGAAQAQGKQPQQAKPAQLSDHAPPNNQFQQQPQQGVPTNG